MREKEVEKGKVSREREKHYAGCETSVLMREIKNLWKILTYLKRMKTKYI